MVAVRRGRKNDSSEALSVAQQQQQCAIARLHLSVKQQCAVDSVQLTGMKGQQH